MNRRIAGKKAKSYGDMFEGIFETQCLLNKLEFVRIPDGAKVVGSGKFQKIIRVKSPFDYIVSNQVFAAFIDTKTTDKDRFAFSDINQSQVDELGKLDKAGPSGYVIWYREINCVVFYTTETLVNLRPRQSLKFEDGLHLGGVKDFNLNIVFDQWELHQ